MVFMGTDAGLLVALGSRDSYRLTTGDHPLGAEKGCRSSLLRAHPCEERNGDTKLAKIYPSSILNFTVFIYAS